MKKKWRYLVVFCIMFGLLAGCAPSQEYHEHAEEPAPEVTEAPAPTQTPLPAAQLEQLENKSIGWGFRRLEGERPEFGAVIDGLMEEYRCMYLGCAEEKFLYLTFDEGYENGYTAQILDTLKKTKVPAAFFITGSYLETSPELVARMVEEGHIVGNHTMNHPSLPSVNLQTLEEELTSLDLQFYQMFGQHMRYLRPPKGEFSARTLACTQSMGYVNVFWSAAYKDWDTKRQKGADYAFRMVMKNLHPGSVILLHAVSKDNADALERIIDHARAAGYQFKSLDEYVY